jgi:hypothetical protein
MFTQYKIYAELAAVLAILGVFFGAGYHFGGLSAKTALEAQHAAQLAAVVKAYQDKDAAEARDRINDNLAELQHAKELADIDAAKPRTDPVVVYRIAATVCRGPVPSNIAGAGSIASDPAAGRSEPVDRGRDIRPDVEALKKRLEQVMADYRELKAEWPGQPSKPDNEKP